MINSTWRGGLWAASLAAVGAACVLLTAAHASAAAQNPAPVPNARKYVNPLNLPTTSDDGSPRGVSLGDPTVVLEDGQYYLFATGSIGGAGPMGGAWVSSNLVDWTWKPLHPQSVPLPIAPDIKKIGGKFYMSGNAVPLYRSDNILGPYVEVGPWLDNQGRRVEDIPTTNGIKRTVFDVQLFLDKDNKPYVYMAYGQTGGVWGAPLDPNNLNRLAAPPKDLMSFKADHAWERAGNANERTNFSYIEGPWVFERNGTYYLQYSASGTEWLTYATGVYTAKNPLGPYTYMAGNPLLRQTRGVNTGPGHGSVVKGPDGNWWQFYLTVLGAPPGGRRLGMDPLGFGPDGRAYIRGGAPSETPQWAPGVVADPARDGDTGSVPLTFGKTRGLRVSSQVAGRDAGYALDNFNGTWWSPAADDAQPTLTLDLLGIPPYDKLYNIDSVRLQFRAGNLPGPRPGEPGGDPRPAALRGVQTPAPPIPPEQLVFSGSKAFRYKVETSVDGQQFTTVADKTAETVTRYTAFAQFTPARARYVRLTFTDWPRAAVQPLGVVEFTAFGRLEP